MTAVSRAADHRQAATGHDGTLISLVAWSFRQRVFSTNGQSTDGIIACAKIVAVTIRLSRELAEKQSHDEQTEPFR